MSDAQCPASSAVMGSGANTGSAESEARAQRAGLDRVRWERDPAGPEIELINVQLVEPASVPTPGAQGPAGRVLLVVGRVAAYQLRAVRCETDGADGGLIRLTRRSAPFQVAAWGTALAQC